MSYHYVNLFYLKTDLEMDYKYLMSLLQHVWTTPQNKFPGKWNK